jgi:periplasmic protein TonB
MTRPYFRLALALTLSLLFHLAPFVRDLLTTTQQESRPPPLQARLAPPPAHAPTQPPLELPSPAKPVAEKQHEPNKQASKTVGNKSWSQEIRRQFQQQHARGLYYPAEAIARGLQGEVLVLMILDETGQVSAARIEQSSGHTLLDEAALRAVRSLHSLPADAPREAVLPVRFSLH